MVLGGGVDEVVIVKKNKKKSKCMVSFFSIEFYPIPDVFR